MDVTVTDTGPCRKTLAITVPVDRIKEHIANTYRSAANQVQLKGFRKGKVPRAVLEKRFGSEILVEAKMQLVNECFQDALSQHDLAPVGDPELEGIGEEPLDEAAGLEFQVHVDVKPEFELGSVRGIEITRGSEDVNDDDINNALGQLAEEKRTLKSVDSPVSDGDFVKMKLVYENEAGETVHEQDDARLNTNIPIAGTDPQVFADVLRGAEKDADLQVEITYPDSFEKEDVRGQKGTVKMKLLEVLRVTPAPIDDELAKGYEFETIDALKEDLTKRLDEEKKRQNKLRQEEDLFNALIASNPFPLPDSLIAQQKKAGLEQFRRRLAEAKVPEEDIEKRLEESDTEAGEDAERRVRLFFLIEAIAAKEKIFVTENDVEVELRSIAAQNGVELAQVKTFYEEHKLLPDLRLGLKERKVREFLREQAKLTD